VQPDHYRFKPESGYWGLATMNLWTGGAMGWIDAFLSTLAGAGREAVTA
jgi:hypothetical protein